MTYREFETYALRLGRVDFDKVFGYQCVDLVKLYMYKRYKVPNGAYGNAIDYWYRTSNVVLQKFKKVAGSNAKAGDIVIFETNVTPMVKGMQPGHIGVATGGLTSTSVEILEQNGSSGGGTGTGGDAIRKRYKPRYRVAGLLRPRSTAVYYTVVSGDTLGEIADRYNTTVSQLVTWNKAAYPSLATNPNNISIGWKLRVK